MSVVTYKPRSYKGKHNRSKLALFVLLDVLRVGESAWSKGEYYPLSKLSAFGVESLSYEYLRVRLSVLWKWGYLHRKPLAPVDGGRAVYGYAISKKGLAVVEKAPEAVYQEALARVTGALPWLAPGPMNTAPKAEAAEPDLPDEIWHPEEEEHEPEPESTFEPDSDTLYCLPVTQAGVHEYRCGYPQRKCAFYEEVPEGAVVLHRPEDWNKTRPKGD